MALSTLILQPSTAFAQGTAFSYQGRLDDGANAANGIYDLRFRVYDSSGGAGVIAGPITNSPVAVSNGLFAVTLDFGAGVFTGPARWLEIGVRSNLLGDFTTLTPRQALTATPYAITSGNTTGPVDATQLTGTLPDARLSANVSLFGPSVQSGEIANGTIQPVDLNLGLFGTTFWKTDGNAATTPGTHFLGTTDNQPLEFKVNGERAFRLEPNPGSPNVIGGAPVNFITPGVKGATITGGGEAGSPNQASADFAALGGGAFNVVGGAWSTIAGGRNNLVEASTFYAVISGGRQNLSQGSYATVGGGFANIASNNATAGGGAVNRAIGDSATVGGGVGNLASGFAASIGGGGVNNANGQYSAVVGGAYNTNAADNATIGGGTNNNIGANAGSATIAGGSDNGAYSWYSAIGGGHSNHIASSGSAATIAGGVRNRIESTYSTIGGGEENNIGADYFFSWLYGTIGGGRQNNIGDACDNSTIGGGLENNIGGGSRASTIGGGSRNHITNGAYYATIPGGNGNAASATFCTVGGGSANFAAGLYATVPGGVRNNAEGDFSFAAGNSAKANHDGAFVWADGTDADFASDRANQFKIRAGGGMHVEAASSGLNPPALRVESTTANGVAIQARQTSSDATLVLGNSGSGDLIKAFSGPTSGALVFRVDNDGDVTAKSFISTSDRNAKDNFQALDPQEMLAKVASLPITRWTFKRDPTTRHIGPMAQDFHAAFGLGPDDKHIATVDADGVALAAIQGLNTKVESGKQKTASLEQRLEQRETEITELKQKVGELEQLIQSLARVASPPTESGPKNTTRKH